MARPKKKVHASGLVEHKATIGKTINGKRIQKSFYGKSKLEAKQKAEAYILEQEIAKQTGEIIIKNEYTFEEWSTKWLEVYKKPTVSENTYLLMYKNTVENHLIPFFGKAKLVDIKPADIQSFFASKKKMSESMLSKMRVSLLQIFETAIDNEICFKNPVRNINFSSEATPHLKKVYTAQEIEKVKELSFGKMNEVIILLETGIRRGELLGLKWSDIDFENKTLSINRSIAVSHTSRVKINPPKWNSYRTIPLKENSLKILKMIIRKHEYIFPLSNGTPQIPNTWSQKLKRFMDSLPNDISKLTAHELRHTYGTDLRRQGIDIYTIQKVMGHKDIKMTSELYVHNEIDELKKAMKNAL